MRKREIELDIAMNAGYLIATGEIEINDSRDFLHNDLPEIAEMYLDIYSPNIGEDYLESIDVYSDIQLKSRYGKDDGKKTYKLHTDVGIYEYQATGPENAKSQFRDEHGYNFIKIHSVKEV